MKKILFSLGSVAVVAAPFAALVSCGNDKVSAPFKETARTDDEIATEIADAAKALAIQFSPSLRYFDDGQGNNSFDKETVKKYWNKPEGETFRLAALTNAIGEKIWAYKPGPPSPADAVIRSIVFGAAKDLEKNSNVERLIPTLNAVDVQKIKDSISTDWDKLATDPADNTKPLFADKAAFEAWVDGFLGKTYEELNKALSNAKITEPGLLNSTPTKIEAIKKLASNKLNDYKVELIKNIESTLSKFDVTASLQKFDGFINWFIDPKDNYKNLKETLIAGKINKDVLQGIQDELNKPSDPTIIGGKTDIVIIEPTA